MNLSKSTVEGIVLETNIYARTFVFPLDSAMPSTKDGPNLERRGLH